PGAASSPKQGGVMHASLAACAAKSGSLAKLASCETHFREFGARAPRFAGSVSHFHGGAHRHRRLMGEACGAFGAELISETIEVSASSVAKFVSLNRPDSRS